MPSLKHDSEEEACSVKARDVFAMLAVAKSLPDALKIVTRSEDSTEDGVMQCFIGLDGSAEIVPISQGMTMSKLKKKVENLTGIPVGEQKYVFADNAQLVGASDPVPTNATLRCVRSQSDDERSDSSQKDGQVTCKDGEVEASSEGDIKHESRHEESVVDDTEERKDWADLRDDDSDSASIVSKEEVDTSASADLARSFTERWRAWDEQERQHQFHIAIPEHVREGMHVVEQIKTAAAKTHGPNIFVRLRGRGSGFLELPRHGRKERESTDPLMICLSGRPPYSIGPYWHAFYMLTSLLEEIYARYNPSVVDPGSKDQEVHVTDDWVHGGVRPHGRVEASRMLSISSVDGSSDANKLWAQEFTDSWRKWDESERQHQFYITLPEHRREEFQVGKRIKSFCRDSFLESVMLRCRGRGSGFAEGKHKAESTDPLMICISGRRDKYELDDYWWTFYKLSAFLQALYADYNQSERRKSQEVHLVYKDVNGGARKGARINA